MKTTLLNVVTVACLLLFPIFSFGQTLRPTMGTTENFVLFTTNGALTNTGASQLTLLTGDVGSNTAPLSTNLGNIDGSIYSTGDEVAQCASDLVDLYNELYGLSQDYALATLLGGPIPLPPGIYANNAVTTLDGNLILDADGNPDALFIFVIKAPGTFATMANSSIELINGAQACNVFWLVEGTVSLAFKTTMKGTIVSAAAIAFAAECNFEGRALTKVGAITINNGETGFLAQKPIGCGIPALTGPAAPELATAGCFALFTGNGLMENSGTSIIVGDVGSNTSPPTGFELPTTIDGVLHTTPDEETIQADLDLSNAFDYLVALPHDIVLLAPALFGYDLILTPQTYVLAAETHLTGDLYLDAQGNPDAVFVIKVDAAFFTAVDSRILLINEAKAENVYWKVTGAVSIEAGSIFEGTIVATGAIALKSTTALNGRALTKTGNFSTFAITAISAGCSTPTPPEIPTQPIDQEACVGGSASYTVVATGSNLTYQWRKGIVNLSDITANISGATTATLTINPVALSDAGSDYNVVVTGSVDPFTVTSNNVSLTVNTAPEITLQPENQVGCPGALVSFTVEATGTDITYQWRKGEVNLVDIVDYVSGVNTATLTIDPVSTADIAENYNVVVSGKCTPNVISDFASLAIGSAPAITVQPTNQTDCEGSSISFSVTATGSDLTYQWRIGEVDLEDMVDHISGVNTATLTINPISIDDAAVNYNVVVSGSCTPSVISNNASLIVKTAPVITLQPVNKVGCIGALVSFTVEATGTDITYQWRKGVVNLVDIADHISGVNTATLTIDPVSVDDLAENYNVVISGVCGTDVTSDFASLVIGSTPAITVHPTNKTECTGASISFSVTATGSNLTYQWRIGEVDLEDMVDHISGVNTATLTIDPVSIDDAAVNYNVVVSGACTPSVISNNASLTVKTAPEITLQPTNQNGCVGSLVSFTVEATGTDITYQWRKGLVNITNTGNLSGATTATLTIDPVGLSDEAPNYDVVITGVCGSPAASNNASLVVGTSPVITEQPTDQTANVGGVASFSVTATGKDIKYQWRKGTENLTTAGNILGATSSTLIIDPVSEADAAENYNVVISGACDPAVTSEYVSLTVTPTGIPVIDSKKLLTLYPNPFTESVNIRVNDVMHGKKYELLIYNTLGELVGKTIITEQITVIETSQLAIGIYYYQVIGNDKAIQSGKLIKQQ